MNHEAGIILNLPTLILTPSLRPDKPRIPFEDMDCKVTFKVMHISTTMKVIMTTTVNISAIMIKPSQMEVAPLHRTVVISHKRRLFKNTKDI